MILRKVFQRRPEEKKNGHTFRLFAVDPDSNFEFPQSAQFASGEPTTPELRPKEDSEITELLELTECEDGTCCEEPESIPEEVSPPPVLPSEPNTTRR